MTRPRLAWLDGFAISASTLCLIHCLALPLLAAAIPALAELLDLGPHFHLLILALAIPASALALAAGYRRHGLVLPVLAGVAGLLLLAAGTAIAATAIVEVALTVAGSLILAAAHLANWRLTLRRARRSGTSR